jgi:molybdopterin converting factor small subunit
MAMAVVRFFAQARQAAGTGRAEFAGTTVGSVIEAAIEQFGPALAAVVERSKLWVNGEPCEPGTGVGPADEIAVLPPVSGG